MFKGIPKSEKVWAVMRPVDGSVWYITTKQDDRSTYYLYKDDGAEVKKISKSHSPMDLERMVW